VSRIGSRFDFLRFIAEGFEVDIQLGAAVKIRKRIDSVAQPFGQRPEAWPP
jgi:hypothetical protein